MAITEKTRKFIWGHSGNRCAKCRHELMIDATDLDDESVIGDECHIVSGQKGGPRYDPNYPAEDLDKAKNLILLCKVHHKVVDDQEETYTAEMLRKLKADHEAWVSSWGKQPPPVRIRRIKENIPSHIIRLMSGKGITNLVGGANAYSFDHDQPESEAETELLGEFLQECRDLVDLWSGFEAIERVRTSFKMGAFLKDLEKAGFWVFGWKEIQRIEGGVGQPSDFPVAILRVLRSNNPEIITLDLKSDEQEVDS
jgi:hypothetical protein